MADLPTRRLRIRDVANAAEEVRGFLMSTPPGERAWCEVWYPAPEGCDGDEWEAAQRATFDAVELVNGELVTLPPYADIIGPTYGGAA